MKKHSFEFPADQLGRPGAVKAYRGNKNDYVTPVADLSGMGELLTNTPLEAIEVYSQFGQDRLGAVLIDRAQGWAYSDRSGTLFIEESEDNNSWTASHSVAVKGGVLTASGWVSLTKDITGSVLKMEIKSSPNLFYTNLSVRAVIWRFHIQT